MIKNRKLSLVLNKIKKFESGELALTKNQIDELYNKKHSLIKILKQSCKHNNCQLYKVHEVDQGYGVDRDYYYHGIKCIDCDEHLITGSNIYSFGKIHDVGSFKKLYNKYKSYFLSINRYENLLRIINE